MKEKKIGREKLSAEVKKAMERLKSNSDHVHKISWGHQKDSLTLSYLMRIEDLCLWANELVQALEIQFDMTKLKKVPEDSKMKCKNCSGILYGVMTQDHCCSYACSEELVKKNEKLS